MPNYEYDPERALWKPGRRFFLFGLAAGIIAPALPSLELGRDTIQMTLAERLHSLGFEFELKQWNVALAPDKYISEGVKPFLAKLELHRERLGISR